jgi:TetR/AcrR family transcriptional regulator
MGRADGNSNGGTAQDRRGRLLEAAILEFAKRGLAGARIDSIARAAGANKQLLYHYFGDKAQLERAVMSAVMRRQDEEDALYPESHSLAEYMALRCRRSIRPLARLWGRLLAWEALEHGGEGSIHFDERRARYRARIVDRVRASQASGEIDLAFDPSMLALAMLAIELIPRALPNVTRMVTGFNGDEPEFTDRLISVMDELIAHIGPVSAPRKEPVKTIPTSGSSVS